MKQSETRENGRGKPAKISECFRHIRTYNCINNNQGSKHNAFLSDINIVILSLVWRVFSTSPMVSVVMVKTRSKRLRGVPVLAASSQQGSLTKTIALKKYNLPGARITQGQNKKAKNLRDRLAKKYPLISWPCMKILWK